MAGEIEVERRGGLTYVWLDRPSKRNALNEAVLTAITEVFGLAASDYDTRAIVLGGRGPSFCAGVDLGDPPGAVRMAGDSGASARERRRLAQIGLRAVRAIKDCDVPTVARIQGHAIGGGALIAVACDIRVMATDAVFAVPEIDLAIPLTWAGTPLLVSEVGAARARELIMLGDRVGCEEAVRIGLAHRAVPPRDLDAAVDDVAQRLAAKADAAMHVTKAQFRAYGRTSLLGDVSEFDGDMLANAMRAARGGNDLFG